MQAKVQFLLYNMHISIRAQYSMYKCVVHKHTTEKI
jgi:hypothetical protein